MAYRALDAGDADASKRKVSKIVYPDLSAVSLVYHEKGNITAVTNEQRDVYTYLYDKNGNILTKNLPKKRS